MKIHECRLTDEIFSHLDDDGIERHFNTTAMMRDAIANKVKPVHQIFEITKELADHIYTHHGVEEHHLANTERIDQPILAVLLSDGFHLIVDGNHRLVQNYRRGSPSIKVFLYHPGQWEPYLVTDMNLPPVMFAQNTKAPA